MKILFTGGGTGGHVFPIISIVRELIDDPRSKEIDFLYIGPKDDFVFLFLAQEGVRIRTVLAGKIRRYLDPIAILLNIIDMFALFLGFFQAFFWVFFENPDIVFSKGGYGSIPVVFAAKIMQVPIFLHESDAVPGLANRIAGKTAIEIFTSFPRTGYFNREKMILVGNPIRKQLLYGSKQEGREMFNIRSEKPILLVMGSSLGAQKINDLLLLILPELLKDFEVFHQTGMKNFNQVEAEAKVVVPDQLAPSYHIFPFLKEHEFKHILAITDFIVSRASSGAIFEIAAIGLPSILIPLPQSAQGHQLQNAYSFAETGATEIIEEANLTPHFFLERLKLLFSRPETLSRMSQRAKEFSKPNAARVIANYILEYLTA